MDVKFDSVVINNGPDIGSRNGTVDHLNSGPKVNATLDCYDATFITLQALSKGFNKMEVSFQVNGTTYIASGFVIGTNDPIMFLSLNIL